MFLPLFLVCLVQSIPTVQAYQAGPDIITTLGSTHLIIPQSSEEKRIGREKAYSEYKSNYRWGTFAGSLAGYAAGACVSTAMYDELNPLVIAASTATAGGLVYWILSHDIFLNAALKKYQDYNRFENIKNMMRPINPLLLRIIIQAENCHNLLINQIKMLFYKSTYPLHDTTNQIEDYIECCFFASEEIADILHTHDGLTNQQRITLNYYYGELRTTLASLDNYNRRLAVSFDMQQERDAIKDEQERLDRLAREKALFEQQKLVAQAQIHASYAQQQAAYAQQAQAQRPSQPVVVVQQAPATPQVVINNSPVFNN